MAGYGVHYTIIATDRLFPCNDDGLVEACLFGAAPLHTGAALGKQQLCELLPPGSPVFTIEFAYREAFLILDDVLGKAVGFLLPGPGLEGDPLPLAGLMDVGR